MKRDLEALLYQWPKPCIEDRDLAVLLPGSQDARYGLVKRALKDKTLVRLKKGLYQIGKPYNAHLPNLFDIAQLLYGPSYISLGSALSYHRCIPEAVYTITSVTPNRGVSFKTELAHYHFSHIPAEFFYSGVKRVEEGGSVFLMGTVWKALADYVYVYRKSWKTLTDLRGDLRIELDSLQVASREELEMLCGHYPSKRVRIFLKQIAQELSINDNRNRRSS